VTNPLQIAIDTMALNEVDLEKWLKIYEKIDVDKAGKVSIEQLFEFLDERINDIAMQIFLNLDALDSEGLLEFGDFLRCFSVFCFFGNDEILRFLFLIFMHNIE
jgi:Ca2+-binding EF-hand superfamily protein